MSLLVLLPEFPILAPLKDNLRVLDDLRTMGVGVDEARG